MAIQVRRFVEVDGIQTIEDLIDGASHIRDHLGTDAKVEYMSFVGDRGDDVPGGYIKAVKECTS
jgi:hypothetical protein